jgi:hypothetical protein
MILITPGEVVYKEKYNTEACFNNEIIKNGVSMDMIKAPTETYKPLQDFIVDPNTYSLDNHIVDKAGKRTRRQYLQEEILEIINNYFIGEHEPKTDAFFGNGSG